MQEFPKRLKHAREKAGYTSASEAARALGMPGPTYLAYENGTRGSKGPAPAIIRQFARKFRVNFVWLASGEGPITGTMEAIRFDGLEPEDVQLLADMAERLRQAREKAR